MRKPRSDSVLKSLPADKQLELAEYMRGGHSLAETRKWLADQGIKSSTTAISLFLGWWSLGQRLQRNQTVVDTLLEHLAKRQPGMSQEQLFEVGQLLFSGMAIEQQDASTWVNVQRVAAQHRGVKVDERRVALLETKAAKADEAQAVVESELTPDEKMARMKAIFGMTS